MTGERVNGFYAVSYGELSGYASAQYLNLDADSPQATAEPTAAPEASRPVTGRIGTVTAQSGLNLRADSSQYANVLATLGYGGDGRARQRVLPRAHRHAQRLCQRGLHPL